MKIGKKRDASACYGPRLGNLLGSGVRRHSMPTQTGARTEPRSGVRGFSAEGDSPGEGHAGGRGPEAAAEASCSGGGARATECRGHMVITIDSDKAHQNYRIFAVESIRITLLPCAR
jgi:hypothetical protein